MKAELKAKIDEDLESPEFFANPYPTYERLRKKDPVYWSDSWNSWVITRPLRRHGESCVTQPIFPMWAGRPLSWIIYRKPGQENFRPLRQIFEAGDLLNSDPPNHTRLRGLVNKAFTPRTVAQLRPRVQEIVDELLDAVQDVGRMDVVRDFAYPLPTTVIAELLGVPRGERARFNALTWALRLYFGGVGYRQLENAERVQRRLPKFMGYFRGLLAERRKHPRERPVECSHCG